MYIHKHHAFVCVCIYIYIYLFICLYINIHIYIYIYYNSYIELISRRWCSGAGRRASTPRRPSAEEKSMTTNNDLSKQRYMYT